MPNIFYLCFFCAPDYEFKALSFSAFYQVFCRVNILIFRLNVLVHEFFSTEPKTNKDVSLGHYIRPCVEVFNQNLKATIYGVNNIHHFLNNKLVILAKTGIVS